MLCRLSYAGPEPTTGIEPATTPLGLEELRTYAPGTASEVELPEITLATALAGVEPADLLQGRVTKK
ncbi:hypothetical protein Ais01nite_68840 [Asanoa ishikariensis]|nr:hypothetical protein Ais01nite_68840 [Asanoa ishikariensis]